MLHVCDVHVHARGHGHVRDCGHAHGRGRGSRSLGLNMCQLLLHGPDGHGCVHGRGCGRGHDDHGHGRLHSQDSRRCLCQHLHHNRFPLYDQTRLSQYFFDNLLIIAYHNAFHLYNEFHHNLD